MVTSVTPNASLSQLAINCSTPSDTCKGVGFVTLVRSPDDKPDPKRTRLSAHPSPTLPRALIDLQQSMLDVAENGEDEFVDEDGKRYCIDDEPDEELELYSDDGEEDDKEVDSEETQSGNEVLATELKTRPTVSNPGFNFFPVKDFNFLLRNYFSCKQCGAQITETNLVSVRVGCACNDFWKCSNMDCGLHAEILAKRLLQKCRANSGRPTPTFHRLLATTTSTAKLFLPANRQVVVREWHPRYVGPCPFCAGQAGTVVSQPLKNNWERL
jgi:hypothetical protein